MNRLPFYKSNKEHREQSNASPTIAMHSSSLNKATNNEDLTADDIPSIRGGTNNVNMNLMSVNSEPNLSSQSASVSSLGQTLLPPMDPLPLSYRSISSSYLISMDESRIPFETPPSPHSAIRLQPLLDDVRPLPASLDTSSSSIVSDTSSTRLRSFSNTGATLNRPTRRGSLQQSFIHMLPDPSCLINSKGQIGQLNSAFEILFRTVLLVSLNIFDFVEVHVLEALRESLSEGSASMQPLLRQFHSSDISGVDECVWTLSSLGGLDSLGTHSFLVMFSRPRLESVLKDLSPPHTRDERRISVGSSVNLPNAPHTIDSYKSLSAISNSDDLSRSLSNSEIELAASYSEIVLRMDSNTSTTSSKRSGSTSVSSGSIMMPDSSEGHDRFSRRFIHELKTPMHVILNCVALLEDTVNPTSEIVDIKNSAQEVIAIINDYAFLSSSISFGFDDICQPARTQLSHDVCDQPINLSSFIQDVAKQASSQLRLEARSFHFNTQDCDELVFIEKIYLGRILYHLFNNAVKFSSADSAIISHVSASRQSSGDVTDSTSTFNFRIANTCLPTFNARDIVASLQNSFIQTQEYLKKKEDMKKLLSHGGNLACSHGLGFGLSVAANMVRLLGGKLVCHCEAGNTVAFSFSIPLMKHVVSRVNSDESEEFWLQSGVSPVANEVIADESPPRRGSKIFRSLNKAAGSILVVDDSAVCRKVMVSKLIDDGFVTEVAVNGLEACQIIESNPDVFDAILLDLHMPVMDGIAATKFIRCKLDSKLPILILSAEQGDSKAEALREGANGFMDKPSDAKDVISKLRLLISEYKNRSK